MPSKTDPVTQLTPKQEARLEAFREEWFAIGSCTDPADRPRAEAAMAALYLELEKKPPDFVWCPSPMNIQVEIHHKDPGQKLGGLFWEKLGNHAKSPIHIAVAKTARENLSLPLWRTISARLKDPLFDAIGAGMVEVIDGQLEHDLEINAPSRKSPILSGQHSFTLLGGQHDVHWMAEIRFCEEIGLTYEPKVRRVMAWWEELARSCMWCWPFEGLCFISDRPEAIYWKDERPHRETGPALVFRDGWGAWAWKGIGVPKEIIATPATLEGIRAFKNIEHQRILIDRYGLERYCEDSGAREVARDEQGVLLEMEMPGNEVQQLVRVENPTPGPNGERRTYLLPLEGRYKTPTDAIGSTFGIRPGSYKPTGQA